MTGKQRAYLRGLAHSMEAVAQIGKQGVTPEAVAGIDEALTARELVKVSVLPSCEIPAEDAAHMTADRTRSECVQVIGHKFVLYRRAKVKPIIELPK